MKILTVDEVIYLHDKAIEQFGGESGLRDYGLLESAVHGVQAQFAGQENYPTVEEKAARLCYSLIKNHAFVDGNKRIGVICLRIMLEWNQLTIHHQQKELIDLGLSVADGTMSYANLLVWIHTHLRTA